MSKEKLCLVIPSLQAGGMERVMSELTWHFSQKENLELYLVLYGKNREIFYSVPESIAIYKPGFNFNKYLRFLFTLRTIWFLRTTIKSIDPHSILSFGELWNSLVLLALLGLKYPVYISDRCSPDRKYNSIHKFLRIWLYPKAKGIISQTNYAKETYFYQFNHPNIIVIGNPIRNIGVDHRTKKENIVLMVGRLIYTKHQDKLIEIFLKIDHPEWKLVLVGYDHLKQKNFERLQEIIEINEAQNRILLEGRQSDVDKYYNISKIFAFTSSSEGFPNAIGEAMSAGLPVVAYDCVAGPSDMITNGHSGYLVPTFDDKQFQHKLENLMKDEKLRNSFGLNAREEIKKFSISIIGNQFLRFILH